MADTPGNTNVMVSLDLELNKQGNHTTSIIQIGLCIFNINTRVLIDNACLYVNSRETLNPFIVNLTGITQTQHDNGISLLDAYSQVKSICNRYGALRMVTWGSGDHETLKKQLNIEHPEWIFGRGYWDTKKLYQSYRLANQLSIQSGLSKSMAKMGLQFKGRKHNAKDDAINTALMFMRMLELMKEKKD